MPNISQGRKAQLRAAFEPEDGNDRVLESNNLRTGELLALLDCADERDRAEERNRQLEAALNKTTQVVEGYLEPCLGIVRENRREALATADSEPTEGGGNVPESIKKLPNTWRDAADWYARKWREEKGRGCYHAQASTVRMLADELEHAITREETEENPREPRRPTRRRVRTMTETTEGERAGALGEPRIHDLDFLTRLLNDADSLAQIERQVRESLKILEYRSLDRIDVENVRDRLRAVIDAPDAGGSCSR